MAGQARKKTYALLSFGLWQQRADFSRLLDAEIVAWPFAQPGRIDGYIGWGRKASPTPAVSVGSLRGHQAPVSSPFGLRAAPRA